MKLTIRRQYLLKLLNFVSAAIPAKTAESQFLNFLIEVKEDEVSVVASDGTISARSTLHKMEGDEEMIIASEPGIIQVQANFLLEIVRQSAGDIVTLSMIDSNFLSISDENADFNLTTKPGDEYPDVDLNIPEGAKGFRASIKDLKVLFDTTAYAAATKGPRELFYGINVSAKDGRLHFLATDSFRMACYSLAEEDSDAEFSFTCPVKALNMITSLPEDEECTIYFDERRALFSTGDNLLSTRLLSGDFPSIERLIPSSFPYQVTFATDDLLKAAGRVKIISSAEDRNSQAKLTISRDEGVILSARSANYGNSREVIKNAEYTLPDGEYLFEIGFNVEFVIEAVKALRSDRVTFTFASSVQMFMARNEDENNIQIITPIRLSSFN